MKTIKTNTAINRSSSFKHYLALDLLNIKDNFNNLSEIYSFLDTLIIKELKFKQLHKPVLIPYYHGKVDEDCGVSCYSFFNGGYVAFHIFEKRKLAYFDIVSEHQLNTDRIINFVSQTCKTQSYNIHHQPSEYTANKDVFFGPHYIAQGKLKKNLDLEQLLKLQNMIISKIHMTPITHPVIVHDNANIRLFIAIAESHIAISVGKKQLRLDVFSCKMFNIKILQNVLNKIMDSYDDILFHRLNKQKSDAL